MRAISNARVRIFRLKVHFSLKYGILSMTLLFTIAVVKSMGRGGFFLEVRAPISPAVGHFVKADSGRNIKTHGLWRGGLFTRECAGRALNNHKNGKRVPA